MGCLTMTDENTDLWNAVRWLQADVLQLTDKNRELENEVNKLRAELVVRTDPRLFDRGY